MVCLENPRVGGSIPPQATSQVKHLAPFTRRGFVVLGAQVAIIQPAVQGFNSLWDLLPMRGAYCSILRSRREVAAFLDSRALSVVPIKLRASDNSGLRLNPAAKRRGPRPAGQATFGPVAATLISLVSSGCARMAEAEWAGCCSMKPRTTLSVGGTLLTPRIQWVKHEYAH